MKILICAAGSGGHIYPALRLAAVFRATTPAADLQFVCTSRKIEQNIFTAQGYAPIMMPTSRMPSRADGGGVTFYLKNILFLLQLMCDVARAGKILMRVQPQVVVGFGGIGSLPVLLAAVLMRIPTVIHEQNVIPGLANKVLARMVSTVAVGFAQCARNFRGRAVVVTGNPVRDTLSVREPKTARAALGLDPERCTVLIFGGSQGSTFLNAAFVQAVTSLPEPYRRGLQCIHLTGGNETNDVATAYRSHAVMATIKDYMDDMSTAYSAADIIICRAGAGTLSELSFFRKPALLIPYPYARAHQGANAAVMRDQRAAMIIEQNELTAARVSETLRQLIDRPEILRQMQENSGALHDVHAAEKLRDVIVSTAQRRRGDAALTPTPNHADIN